jgi:hypothetical protein
MNMELPRVTEILKSAGLIDVTWLTDEGRERGSFVHLACQYLDEGTLDEETVDPAIRGYLEAYKAWRQQWPIPGWTWIECGHQDPMGLYRGTQDRILAQRPRLVLDIKTGCPVPATALQMAAYVNMLPDPYSYQRLALHLKPDGTFVVKEYPRENYAADLRVFMAAVQLYYWKGEHHV